MAFYRNKGDGTFEDRTEEAGVTDQLGGLVCYQTDYNNDGRLDVFIPRAAWLPLPIRPSLLRNDGGGKFTDVTKDAGMLEPVNSNSACWADYDNDGWLDVFIGCERQPNLLYRNRGNGTFEEVAARAGLREREPSQFCKGTTWVDFDNDDYPDLFLNNLAGAGELFHNNRNGTFTNVTSELGIDGPQHGFSCWAWDYDNDGWLDIFATCYDRTLNDVVKGLLGNAASPVFQPALSKPEWKEVSRTRRRKPGWTWFSPPWGATTPISTMTASSTCTWGPASRASPR